MERHVVIADHLSAPILALGAPDDQILQQGFQDGSHHALHKGPFASWALLVRVLQPQGDAGGTVGIMAAAGGAARHGVPHDIVADGA